MFLEVAASRKQKERGGKGDELLPLFLAWSWFCGMGTREGGVSLQCC